MKNLNVLITVIFVTVMSAMTSHALVIAEPGLPASLPIGSMSRLQEWCATNYESEIDLQLTGTNSVDGNNPLSLYSIKGPFRSYADYQHRLATNLWYMFTFEEWNNTIDAEGGLQASSIQVYQMGDFKYYGGMSFRSDFGPVSALTPEWFEHLLPFGVVNATVAVLGMQSFDVVVPGVYTNHWDRQTPAVWQYPFAPELSSPVALVLSEWYSCGTNVFITITIDGETATYDGNGVMISGPPRTLELLNVTHEGFDVTFPKGKYVEVQCSTNFPPMTSDWMLYKIVPASAGTNLVHVTVDQDAGKQQFFRAVIKR